MITRAPHWAHSTVFFLAVSAFAVTAFGQAAGPLHINEVGAFTPNALLDSGQMTMELWSATNMGENRSPLQSPSGSVSKLDIKAPGKARHEYSKGYELLMRKNYAGAVEHLNAAISIYPDFVAAYNSLGSTYLDMGQNDKAREEFAKAISLDDHLPTSYLNLGCAELALKHYRAAEEAIQKATTIAPLDLQFLTALTYAQFLNHDYDAAIATAQQVHSHKHQGSTIVHYYAAAAYDGENKVPESQRELETLLKEDPKSPAAEQARKLLQQLKTESAKLPSTPQVSLSVAVKPGGLVLKPEDPAIQKQKDAQEAKEKAQVAEAESMCTTCDSNPAPNSVASTGPSVPGAAHPSPSSSPWTMRKSVDEVAIFFSATDHGKSVTDLTGDQIGIRDDQRAPAAITGFRNEAQLPLRLGLIIDTSESVGPRFAFEQHAAISFVKKVMTQKDDLAFVVGVASSVLMVQDFTSNQEKIARGINLLAPGGGTAVWDAVAFATDKLAGHTEAQPAARILVVISDGHDNSSSTTLKHAIEVAERQEVIVYTVSTRQITTHDDDDSTGDLALKVLGEGTGGAAFMPGSLGFLNRSLSQLQEVIRSRYLVSYKPALFQRNGKYRAIDITARKSGQKLHVYARKGYYASATPASGITSNE
jgi:Ca-activated chloride channel family protein